MSRGVQLKRSIGSKTSPARFLLTVSPRSSTFPFSPPRLPPPIYLFLFCVAAAWPRQPTAATCVPVQTVHQPLTPPLAPVAAKLAHHSSQQPLHDVQPGGPEYHCNCIQLSLHSLSSCAPRLLFTLPPSPRPTTRSFDFFFSFWKFLVIRSFFFFFFFFTSNLLFFFGIVYLTLCTLCLRRLSNETTLEC